MYRKSARGLVGALVVLGSITAMEEGAWSQEVKSGSSPIAYSKSGKLVAAGKQGMKVVVWETLKEATTAAIELDTTTFGQATALAFAPSGDKLATGTEWGTVVLWDLGKKQVIHVVAGRRERPVMLLLFDARGENMTAYSGGETYRLIDVASGKSKDVEFKTSVASILATTGTALATTSPEGEIEVREVGRVSQKLWSISDPELAKDAGANSLFTLSPDGLAAAYRRDGQFYLAGKDTKLKRIPSLVGLEIKSVAFLPDRKLLAALQTDGKIGIYDSNQWKLLTSVDSGSNKYETIAASPDGLGVTVAGPGGTKPVDLQRVAVTTKDADGNFRVPVFYGTNRSVKGEAEKRWGTHFRAYFLTLNGLIVAVPAVLIGVGVLLALGIKHNLSWGPGLGTVAVVLLIVFAPAVYYAQTRWQRVQNHPGEYHRLVPRNADFARPPLQRSPHPSVIRGDRAALVLDFRGAGESESRPDGPLGAGEGRGQRDPGANEGDDRGVGEQGSVRVHPRIQHDVRVCRKDGGEDRAGLEIPLRSGAVQLAVARTGRGISD